MSDQGHPPPPPKFGYFSAKQKADGIRTNFWATPDGREVEVTIIGHELPATYRPAFPDVVELGLVTEWRRSGQKPFGIYAETQRGFTAFGDDRLLRRRRT